MSDRIGFRRIAGGLISSYLKHQSWKAHEGLFMPISFEAEGPADADAERGARGLHRTLKALAGVKLSHAEASEVWPSVLEHKWYLGERLGRDVGLRVAVVDYFENVDTSRGRVARRAPNGGLPPRLPMMMPLGQKS